MRWPVLSAIALCLAGVARAADLADETYAALRAEVLPKPDESKWLEIPWRPTFWEAVVEAQAQDKPVLLWAMNGHPLACT